MKVYLFILSLFFCVSTFAQSTITGTVTDTKNVPIAGANVKIAGQSTATVTDYDGKFIINTKQKPPFTLEISSVGYASIKVAVSSINQKISVILQDEETKLNEIVVSASRTPERVIESPVTIERMGLQDIKNTTAATFYDGLENLKEVHFNTSSFSFKSINTRGFSTVANTRFMQLVDGMDNSSPALNFVLGNLIGVSDIDVANVELLPGASSALYGANAFNGILFMNSKNPFTNQGISTYVKYGKTTQETAGTNDFVDLGIRAAKAFSDSFAAKANFTFLRASEWIAADTRDVGGSNAVNHLGNINYDGLNSYGDEVTTNIKGVGTTLAGLGVIPAGAVNLLPNTNVSRTGYREQDLTSNNIESVKADFSMHFRPFADKNIEIIGQYKLGLGNTIYQGANRYALKNFFMDQAKIEIKGKNFFARVYQTSENAGDSYDMRFAAWNVNRAWKPDSTWFGQYAGAFIQASLNPALIGGSFAEADKHNFARAAADAGRFQPGSSQFNAALAKVIENPDLREGAKFKDRSKIQHGDVNFNFKDIIKVAEIQVGGSARKYIMNSDGTIFTDYDGPISYSEFGVYTQVQKKFLAEERLKFTGSIRYDKNELFKGFFSPRVSFVYSAGKEKKHNFRVSYQTGFRNPTTQDLYIGLNLGPFALIGSAEENLTRFSETFNNSVNSQSAASASNPYGSNQPLTSTTNGINAYNNSYTIASVQAFMAAPRNTAAERDAASGLLRSAQIGLVKPERVQAFELGYRTVINDLSVDINGYYNIYNDFLNSARVITPYYGVATDSPAVLTDAAKAIANGDRRVYQVYTNSRTEITSTGFGVGLGKKVYKDFELGVNYNFADFKFDQEKDPSFIPGFNTPKHRVKGSFGNAKLFPNFGFNVNVRWSDKYLWQSSFADGIVPSNTVIDAQINYTVKSLKSTFKVGGANLFGKDYIQVIGAGNIGQQLFASWTINP